MTNLDKLKIARTAFNEEVTDVARRFGVSVRYVYEVLKYPSKNPQLYNQIAEYVNSANVDIKGEPVRLSNNNVPAIN